MENCLPWRTYGSLTRSRHLQYFARKNPLI